MGERRALRTVFMGTPAVALPVLAALLDAGHEVAAVYTQPDRPAGRGQRKGAPPVSRYASERGLPVFQPKSLRSPEVQGELASLAPNVVLVAAYGLFLPDGILDMPPLGCLNVHPSLLPRYRGPSPVAEAILNGEVATGVTIMKVDSGMDTGPIIAQRESPIGDLETAEVLTARLFEMGAELLVDVLPQWAAGEIQGRPQDESQASVTRRFKKEDGLIDWTADTDRIARLVRACQPWPGTYTRWRGKLLKIVEASAVAGQGPLNSSPGEVVAMGDRGLGVTTARGVLKLHRLQLEGRQVADVGEFRVGYTEFVGAVLGS